MSYNETIALLVNIVQNATMCGIAIGLLLAFFGRK